MMEGCGTYADGVIAIVYFCVAIALAFVNIKRQDIRGIWIFWYFVPVFTLCGAGHAAHFFTIWDELAHQFAWYIMYAQALLGPVVLVALVKATKIALLSPALEAYKLLERTINNLEKDKKLLEDTIKDLHKHINTMKGDA